jgi:hypothetical protein
MRAPRFFQMSRYAELLVTERKNRRNQNLQIIPCLDSVISVLTKIVTQCAYLLISISALLISFPFKS